MQDDPSAVAPDLATLLRRIAPLGAREAAEELRLAGPPAAAAVLLALLPTTAQSILRAMPEDVRREVLSCAPPDRVHQWAVDVQYPEGSVGRLMELPVGVFRPETTIGEAIEELRELVRHTFITYGFVVDADGRLIGVITMRDLLFNEHHRTLAEVMLREVFKLGAAMPLLEAMKQTLARHYPVYPVVDEDGRLAGLVRGQTMFQQQAIELSAQAGSMVGVEKEERLSTPWVRSLKFRHPWLQVNLLTAFIAAAVVSLFQESIEKIVALAVFLPVLAGQSGNTGCQALAVSLRAMTLGELKTGDGSKAMAKEALLGLCNGALVGLTAGVGMLVFAHLYPQPAGAVAAPPLLLAVVTFVAMIVACVISGVSGATVPLLLKKCGADPATASSIFLTTATDVVSMGAFLGLATLLLL